MTPPPHTKGDLTNEQKRYVLIAILSLCVAVPMVALVIMRWWVGRVRRRERRERRDREREMFERDGGGERRVEEGAPGREGVVDGEVGGNEGAGENELLRECEATSRNEELGEENIGESANEIADGEEGKRLGVGGVPMI